MKKRQSQKFVSKTLFSVLLTGILSPVVLIAMGVPDVFANVTVTAATGGTGILSTTAGTGGSGVYTALTGPSIKENAHGDIATGTIILNAPSGFEFRTTASSVTATVTTVGSCNGGNSPLKLSGGNSTQTVTPTASTITITVASQSSNAANCRSTITYTGIKVRPTLTTPLASGNITKTGTATISGINASTSFGPLSEVAPPTYLTVNVVVVNNNGGTRPASDFTPKIDGSAVVNGAQNTVTPAAHTVSGISYTGYTTTISGDCAANGTITLGLGDVKVCTITNDDVAPQLTVIKHVINDNGGIKVAANFTMNVTGTSVSNASFAGNEAGTTVTLNAGTYSVDEASTFGYAKSLSTDCTGTVAVGDTKTCTITNDDPVPVSSSSAASSIASSTSSHHHGHDDDDDEDHVLVCHNGSTLSVNENAVAAHLGHGDTLGTCPSSSAFSSWASSTASSAVSSAASSAASSAPTCSPDNSSLLAYWKFDENLGNVGIDSTSFNNQSSLLNGATWSAGSTSTSFANPAALSLDGVDDYALDSDTTGLPSGSSARTIALWENSASSTPGHQSTLVSMGNGSTSDQKFIVQIGNEPVEGPTYLFTDGINGANNVTITGGEIPGTGWHHIAFSMDASGNWAYYLDGVLKKSGTFTVPINTVTNAVEIGSRHDAVNGFFHGSLDDVRIYNTALSASQIATLAGGQCTGGSASSSTSSTASSATSSFSSSSSSICFTTLCVPGPEMCLPGGLVCSGGDEPICVPGPLVCTPGPMICTPTPTSCGSSSSSEDNDSSEGNGGGNNGGGNSTEGRAGAHRGHRTNESFAMAGYLALKEGFPGDLPPGGFGGTTNAPLDKKEIKLICAVRRSEPIRNDFIDRLSEYIGTFLLRDAATIKSALLDPKLCNDIQASLKPQTVAQAATLDFNVDSLSYAVSSNGFWNECFRNDGEALFTYSDYMKNLLKNPELDKYGNPYSCSAYFSTNGDVELWHLPYNGLSFGFNRSTMTYLLPDGYAVKHQAAVAQK